MPKFKVLGGRWGEGYEPGQIIELDTDASIKRLELGEIELANTTPVVEPEPVVEEVAESAAAPEVTEEVAEEPVVEEKPKKAKK